MNIAHAIEHGAYLFPAKPALIFEDESFTYQQVNEWSNRAANGLANLGVTRGDRVALWLPNLPAFVFAYLGIQKLGAIAVTINNALKGEETQFILNDSSAKVLITTASLYTSLDLAGLPHLQQSIVTEGDERGALPFATWIATASSERTALELTADDPAALLYTSGTTGFPKGALLSHGNVISNGQVCRESFGLTSDDCVLLSLATFHAYGQNAAMNPCFAAGATLVLHRQFELAPVLRSITTHQVTVFYGVPTLYLFLAEQAPIEALRFIRRYLSAAATLPIELARRWQEKTGVGINEGFGLTETCLNTFNPDLQAKPGSVGKPMAGIELAVVNEEGNHVPVGELGEVLVRGANVMLGYWNRPEESAEALRGGWFHTGDIGRMDEDGYFYIVDRIKDMINVGGSKVYSSEVENVLYCHPAVQEVAVYGIQDETFGEQVCASIILRAEATATAEEVVRFAQQHLAYFKVPGLVEFVDLLPKGRTGKILKRELRERMQQQMAERTGALVAEPALTTTLLPWSERKTPYHHPRTTEEFELAYLWEEIFEFAPIGITDNFFALGGSSQLAWRLVIKMRQKFGKQSPMSILLQYPTIAELAPLMRKEKDLDRWAPVKPIRTKGSKPRLFLAPGLGFDGFDLHPLIRALGEDQPVSILQPVGLDGVTPPHTSIEESAAFYIAEIKKIQPEGPYYIGGYSYGGWIAFEMGQQLYKAGDKIGCIALFDSVPVDMHNSEQRDTLEVILAQAEFYVKDLGRHLQLDIPMSREILEPMTVDERIAWLQDLMQRTYAPQCEDLEQLRAMLKVTHVCMQTAYRPHDTAPVPFCFFQARDITPDEAQHRIAFWSRLGPVEFQVIPGDHTTMLTDQPNATILAQKLAVCLEAAYAHHAQS